MFKQLPNLKTLLPFEAAARHLSFTRAAAELSLTQGAVGYQVRQLEAQLGVSLFHRSVRRLELSPEGERLYRLVHRQLRELQDEVAQLAGSGNKQVLTVAVSTYFVTRWLSQRLGRFLNENPEITLRLQHSVNNPGFAFEAVDLAIRWGNGHWPGLNAERLLDSPMMALCAPQSGIDPAEIPLRDFVESQVFLQDQPSMDRWGDWFKKAGISDLWLARGTVIDDPNVRVQSAIDGQGMVLGNRLLAPEIGEGKLVEPFAIRLEGDGYDLVYREDAGQRASFRIFRQWLLDQVDDYERSVSTT